MAHQCPVCGFSELEAAPRGTSGGGSYEICPSCGFQFGVDDDDRGVTPEAWRARWIAAGKPWSSRGIPQPKSWNPDAQLEKFGASKPVPAKSKSRAKSSKGGPSRASSAT